MYDFVWFLYDFEIEFIAYYDFDGKYITCMSLASNLSSIMILTLNTSPYDFKKITSLEPFPISTKTTRV